MSNSRKQESRTMSLQWCRARHCSSVRESCDPPPWKRHTIMSSSCAPRARGLSPCAWAAGSWWLSQAAVVCAPLDSRPALPHTGTLLSTDQILNAHHLREAVCADCRVRHDIVTEQQQQTQSKLYF